MPGLLKQPRQAAPQGDMQQEQQADPNAMPPEQVAQPGQPAPEQPMPGQPGMDPSMEGGEEENNPAFQAALDQIRTALYEQGAADQINEALTKSQSPIDDIATIAYEMAAVADEKTGGEVPDEFMLLLGASSLAEIVDIAEASGQQMQASDIASAFKMMTIRFAGEMGHDTTALHDAMNQVSPQQINDLAAAEA